VCQARLADVERERDREREGVREREGERERDALHDGDVRIPRRGTSEGDSDATVKCGECDGVGARICALQLQMNEASDLVGVKTREIVRMEARIR